MCSRKLVVYTAGFLPVADYGATSQQQVSGVRVDGGVVVIMTEERDW